MKFVHLILLLMLTSCSQDKESFSNNSSNDESEVNFNLIGGRPVEGMNFNSSGYFYKRVYDEEEGAYRNDYSCTFTRVGKRHLLTASHCIENPDKESRVRLYSHIVGQNMITVKFGKAYAISTISDLGDIDYALVPIRFAYSSIEKISEMAKLLDEYYPIRPIGTRPMRAGDTVLYAGAGYMEPEADPNNGEKSVVLTCNLDADILCDEELTVFDQGSKKEPLLKLVK